MKKDLQVVQTLLLLSESLQFGETPDDRVLAESVECGRGGDERLIDRWLEEVAGIRVVERDSCCLSVRVGVTVSMVERGRNRKMGGSRSPRPRMFAVG